MKVLLVFFVSMLTSTLAVTNYCFQMLSRELDEFSAEVINFEHAVDDAIKEAEQRYETGLNMARRFRAITGSSCDDKHEFQCGGYNPLCLSRLLVCDGVVDCPNGADERQCEALTPIGSSWSGSFYYDHCTKKKPKHFSMKITGYKKDKALLSVPEIEADLHIEDELRDFSYASTYQLNGVVDLTPGAQTLVFRHPMDTGFQFRCTFDGVHRDHCFGEIQYISSGEACAGFYMERSD